ncbi:phage tail tape measure protein [Clostridium novyi]|uniref:phage tail tape measure protein n=1 Tax=Clostridium novyi TaxID=1542 RepID=UPI00057EA679|nr:phage tail tape measure protein [Clostridium novyi]
MFIAHVIDAVLQLHDQFSGQLRNVSQNLNQFQRQVRYASKDMKSVGKATENIGKNLITHVTAPIFATGTAAAKSAMDFKESIANIDTLLDDHSHLKGYEQQVLNISRSTGMSLKTVSEGMYTAVSSLGDSGKQTQEIFKTMANAAKAGGAEVNDSVALISAAMKGYGSVSNETAKKISDLAFQTAKLGVTTFPEMAKSMQPLFPLAKSLNFSYEELFGSMATLTGVTGNTSEVSTQLKAVFSNLMKPTKDMSNLIKKYGFSNAQAMIKSKGLTGVMQILQKETGGSADKMGKLFSSTEAVTALTALTGANFKDLVNKTNEMKKAAGSTDTALRKVSGTTKDKFNVAINNLKVSLTELGVILLPIVTKISDAIAKIANKFNKLSETQKKTIVKFALLAATIGPVIWGIGKMTTTLSTVGFKFVDLYKNIKSAGSILKWLVTPGHMVVIILVALAVAAVLIIKNWNKISKVIKKVGNAFSQFTGISKKSLSRFLSFVMRFGKTLALRFKTAFAGIGKTILPALKRLFNTLKKIFATLKPILMPVLKFIIGVFVVKIAYAFSMITTVISTVINVISGLISSWINIFNGFINFLVGIFTGNWKQAWEGVKGIFSGIVGVLKTLWNGLVTLLTAPVQAVVDILDSVFKDKAEGIKKIWGNIKEFLKHPITGTVNLVKKGAEWVTDKVNGKNALGTTYWGGGFSVVGEHGPEIVEMDSGSKVHDAKDTKKILTGNNGVHVTFTGDIHVREENDIDKIATALVKKIKIAQLNMT